MFPTFSTKERAAFSVQMPRGNSRGTSPGENQSVSSHSLSHSPCEPLHWRKQQSLRALLQQTWRSQEGTQGQCHWCQPRSTPGLKGHDAVVEDVEEGEVGELFLQHEEDGVGKVDELGEVEEPGKVESTKSLRFVWVVDWLTSQAEKKKLELDKNRTGLNAPIVGCFRIALFQKTSQELRMLSRSLSVY